MMQELESQQKKQKLNQNRRTGNLNKMSRPVLDATGKVVSSGAAVNES
jgi:hypothetical protein